MTRCVFGIPPQVSVLQNGQVRVAPDTPEHDLAVFFVRTKKRPVIYDGRIRNVLVFVATRLTLKSPDASRCSLSNASHCQIKICQHSPFVLIRVM